MEILHEGCLRDGNPYMDSEPTEAFVFIPSTDGLE